MSSAANWKAELSELLAAYIGYQAVDRGVSEMVHVSARDPAYHERYLGAIDAGIQAAERQDPDVLKVMSQGSVPADDYTDAAKYLQGLRQEYLKQYSQAD